MANEIRVRTNFLGGLVEDNPLTSGATTLTSAALASVPVIGSTQHMAVVLDPDGFGGAPEVVHITAHTAAATTATVARGQEGSTARAHERDTAWVHSATASDYPVSKTYTVTVATTNTSSNLASLATPVLIAVDVLAGQVVDVEAQIGGYCSQDNVLYWGLRRNPSTVLCKGTWYSASGALRPNSTAARWTDTSPGSGSVTYEILVSNFGGTGTITLLPSDGTTTVSLTGSSGGGTQIKATPRWSG